MKINSVLITTKKKSSEAFERSLEIKAWLEDQGVDVLHSDGYVEHSCWKPDVPYPDLIIILGGDGTILSQARKLLDLDIPLLGVNLGKVGFMAEISLHSWKDQLASLISQGMSVSKRVVLGYELVKDDRVVEQGCAINEVVINRGELARLITVNLELPGSVMQRIRADGIIVATPTGSTAYSVSAGGPLVHPDLEAMIITCICPFLSDFKPLVLPSTQTVTAWIGPGETDAFLTVDGQSGFRLTPGDRVRIFRHPRDFKVLFSPQHSFASKLVAKCFLRGVEN